MAQSKPLDLGNDDVFALTRDYEALRTWELLRGFGVPVTVAELAGARKLAERVIHRHLDLLISHELVEQVRARKPRRSIGYRVAVERIVLTFDDTNEGAIARAKQSSAQIGAEFERCVVAHANPEFHAAVGFRFRTHCMKHFTREDLAELRRLMLPVVEFLSTPRSAPKRSAQSGAAKASTGKSSAATFCNQAVSIKLEPLAGELLPLPDVWMTPRSKLAGAPTEDADKSGIPRLTPREREVALALAEGLTRAHVAERMSVSVHTVSTLARRAYRKLGVTSQAALAARVARYEHKRLGER
jgi:DNA-binding CsgD family transcriptional regulator/DNA-binding transcriptional ArsR family regulator